jgi:tetratricopeptide (TPR) repeat protein
MRALFQKFTGSIVLSAFVLITVSVLGGAQAQSAKKKEEILRKIRELEKKKSELAQKAQKKLDKMKQPSQSLGEIIARYEKLQSSCVDKKSQRCADVIYTLGKLYYDKSRDDYVQARNDYEKAMDNWERNPVGPEPVNPLPDYSKPLETYQQALREYPDFEKADEALYQIGSILMIQGDLDGSKDAFREVVERFPSSIRASAAHFRLADFCFMDRDFTCALKHIEQIKKDEVNLEVQEMSHYRKAEIYYNRAEFDKAAELFFEYVERCDAGEFANQDLRQEALEYLAICFSDMPEGGKKAVAFFEKVGSRPYEDQIIYTVGMKNYNHGQYADAVVALRTALENFPYYKDAPTAQQMVVASLVIKKEYDEANVEREKLVDRYWTDSEWAKRNNNDQAVIEQAKEEVRRALAQIPIHYHAEAQKQKKKDLYKKALARYQEFFQKFPDDKWKVYEFKYNVAEIHNMLGDFESAADAYDFVAQQDLATYPKYEVELDTMLLDEEQKERVLKESKEGGPVAISQEDAGYNAIVALDNLRKKTMAKQGLTDEKAYSLPETQKFLDYIHAFQQRFPNSKTAAEVLYLGANVHYGAKKYDKAISEFKMIQANYPNSEYSSKSTRMLANSYASSGQYEMALSSYNTLLSKEKSGSKEYEEILDLAAGAMFKKASELQKKGELVAAADAYKDIYEKYPKSKVADRGWFEAATCYENNENLKMAASTFASLGDKFPKSELREKAYVRAAENYKKAKEFELAAGVYELAATKITKADYAIPSMSAAAETYQKANLYKKAGAVSEQIYQKYPKDERTPQALYNAGLIYEKGKLYADAIRAYTILADKYPQNEYAAEGFYSIGLCYEKMDQPKDMAAAFSAYAEKFPENRSKQVMALVLAGEAYFKMDNLNEAEKNVLTATEVYDKFKRKADIDLVAASRAYYKLGEIRHKRFNDIELTGRNERQVQQKLKEKTKALEPVLEAYAKAIELGVGEWTIRATYQIGQSFVDMAESYRNQTLFGNRDQKTAAKIKIIQGLEKYYSKAQEKFAWVVTTSYEQGISNKYVTRSRDKFLEMAFRKGRLFEEIGEIFKSAPIPKGLAAEEEQVYRDVLEEKYLEALDFALPKYEEGLMAAADLGIAEGEYLDKIKERIKFINPASEALQVQIAKRTPAAEAAAMNASGEGGEGQAPGWKNDRLERNLRRIDNIMSMNIPVSDKIAQLRSIEADAKREIRKERSRIDELKSQVSMKN